MASAAHIRNVSIKATAGAPSGSDILGGCTNADVPQKRGTKDTTSYSDGIYTKKTVLLFDASASLDLEEDFADSPQGLIRAAVFSGATIYLTDLPDGTNGYTYPMVVTEYAAGGAVGDTRTAKVSLELNGTPVAVP